MSEKWVILAKLVREKENTLFSAFSPTIAKKLKEEIWKAIRKDALAAGFQKHNFLHCKNPH